MMSSIRGNVTTATKGTASPWTLVRTVRIALASPI